MPPPPPSPDPISAGEHVCGIYHTEEEFRHQIAKFLSDGLAQHEKVVYITHSHTAHHLKEVLRAAGADVEGTMRSGQLVFITSADAYLADGTFDPDRMLDLLRETEREALAAGYHGVRATGEMTWALGGDPGSERLIEYEAKLNSFYPRSKVRGICQYDARRFSAETLLEIVQNHPRVLVGRDDFDNRHSYFIPPEGFLAEDRPGAVLQQWLGNLRHNAATHSGPAGGN